ncbi:MAG: type II restriction endonuclease [Verrucomicrobiales bacterium]|nr:type II restriction endonuclease [Verrucomicrobiales bacterium]
MAPHLQHLQSCKDLETTYEAIRAGFVTLALEKNRRATPLVEQARALKAAASQVQTPIDLLSMADIQSALLTAAGVSDKAASHLQDSDKKEAIAGLIGNFLEPAGANFVEELVFRFLLTRGDTLGGSMRNVGGVLAQRRLARSIISHLKNAATPYCWLHSQSKVWAGMPEDDADLELYLRGLSWIVKKQARTLLYNVKVPVAGSHVDMCLLNCTPDNLTNDIYRSAPSYVALGELKGGIDPAGADEHWKTARTALSRIHEGFARNQLKPHTFFIGAAIEPKMAAEIWSFLQSGILENAANLTAENQLASITRWLCSL